MGGDSLDDECNDRVMSLQDAIARTLCTEEDQIESTQLMLYQVGWLDILQKFCLV